MMSLKMVTKLAIISVLCIPLANCAEYDAQMQCRKDAGPKPNAWADSLGPVGVLANNQNPEVQAYYKRVDDCLAAYHAKLDASKTQQSSQPSN